MHPIAIVAFTSFFWLLVIYWLSTAAQRSLKRVADENHRMLLQIHDNPEVNDLRHQLAQSREINKRWAAYNEQRNALTEKRNQSN